MTKLKTESIFNTFIGRVASLSKMESRIMVIEKRMVRGWSTNRKIT